MMKKVSLIAALLCVSFSTVYADKPPPRKPPRHKKIVVVPPPLLVPPMVVVPPEPSLPPPVAPPPPVVVVVPPPVIPAKPCALPVVCPADSTRFVPSAHLAVGVGVRPPWASGLVGLRMEFPSVYLGLEPFMSIPYGVGVDGLVYAYRGKTVQFYPLAVGFMLNWNYNQSSGAFGSPNKFLSNQDVNRLVDLRLGLGVQVKLKCQIRLSIDLRTNIVDPVKLSKESGICHNCSNGRAFALNSKNTVINSLAETQLLVGLLFN